MSDSIVHVIHGVLIEAEVQFTLVELSRVCGIDTGQLVALVDEGVLTPAGDDPQHWRFGGDSLRRARAALRLMRDLELSPAGAALVLDLLDQIETLRSRLQREGAA